VPKPVGRLTLVMQVPLIATSTELVMNPEDIRNFASGPTDPDSILNASSAATDPEDVKNVPLILRLIHGFVPLGKLGFALKLGENILPPFAITRDLISDTGSGAHIAFGIVHWASATKLGALSLRVSHGDEVVFETLPDCGGCGDFLPPNTVSAFILDQEGVEAIAPFFTLGNSVTVEAKVSFEIGTAEAHIAGMLGVYRGPL
jgi:hypothetical protein